MFTAAAVTDPSVRDQLIQGVWNRANFNQTQEAFLDYYDDDTGDTRATDGNAG